MKSLSENINLSILEIFSVLFPGGAMLLLCWQAPDIQGAMRGLLPDMGSEWQVSIAFLGVAYFLGYVLFYLSSFLDEVVYDHFKSKKQALTDSVIRYKTKVFGYDSKNEINAFKWSSALLLAQQPALYAAVERFMAASKFFRSMVLVFYVAAVSFFIQEKLIISLIGILLYVISIFNYIRQRDKAVEAAYQYVITIEKF
ncbi:MAG: hypothetical protein RLZZ292_1102 [Bacteroidota bacterium]|jgi:hypothetical protein